VNNAGVLRGSGFLAVAGVEALRAELDTNFFGPLLLSRAFAPILGRNGAGHRQRPVGIVVGELPDILDLFCLQPRMVLSQWLAPRAGRAGHAGSRLHVATWTPTCAPRRGAQGTARRRTCARPWPHSWAGQIGNPGRWRRAAGSRTARADPVFYLAQPPSPRRPELLLRPGAKGGMSLLAFSGKAGGRFYENERMPSCASAPAAR